MDKSKRTFLTVAGLGSVGVYLGVKGAYVHANKVPKAKKRYAMVVKDGTVAALHVEEPGAFEVSSAEAVLKAL